MKIIIFACVHNAGRSQMAAAFFNKLADAQKAKAISAGTEPAARVHPEVLIVMNDVGIDLSQAHPTLLTQQLAEGVDVLVTMGCGEKCPYVPGLKIVDWNIPDPKGKDINDVRQIRDHIAGLINEFVKSNSWD